MRWEYVSFVLGISLCLAAFFLIVEGSILGERTIPAAVASLTVGIAIILIGSGAKAKKS